MNERDENIIVCLAASVGVYTAILHSIKSSKKKSVGQEMVTGTTKERSI